jgi:hypothetical protein
MDVAYSLTSLANVQVDLGSYAEEDEERREDSGVAGHGVLGH